MLGIVVSVVAVTRVSATSSFWEDVSTKLAQLLAGQVGAPAQIQEATLGSTQTSPTYLTDTGTLNNQGSLYLWDTQSGGGLEVAGRSYFTGGITNTGTSTLGSSSVFASSGSFADATTTLACVFNPFGTTSTARYAAFTNTGVATTSVAVVVSTSTRNVGLTTSTVGFGVNSSAQLLNVNLLRNTTVTNTSFLSSNVTDSRSGQSTQTASSFNVAPNEYVCFVAGEGNGGSTQGLLNTNNLFAGTYDIEFKL